MQALKNVTADINKTNVLNLLSVYESKGKEFYYKELFSARDKAAFCKQVIYDDTLYLARLLKINVSDERIIAILKKGVNPKNKDEYLVRNLANAFSAIHKDHHTFRPSDLDVDGFLRILSADYQQISFVRRVAAPKDLGPEKFINVLGRGAAVELFNQYNKLVISAQFEITCLISSLFIDFFKGSYLTSSQELVAYLFLYMGLLKNFSVFNYVSFFKHAYLQKDYFLLGLNQASATYMSGFVQLDMFNDALYRCLYASYKEVNDLADQFDPSLKIFKKDEIRATIMKGAEIFAKEDIKVAHPSFSLSTINRALQELKEENIIKPLGTGRSAKWVRIKAKPYEFDPHNLLNLDDNKT